MKPFEEVVTEHGPVVWRVCLALLPPADAEDAWAETFLAALRAYPELPATANLQAWLVTIAHRKAIDAVRARGRRPLPVSDPEVAELGAAHRAGSSPDGHALAAEPDLPDPALARAVRALPPRQRAAVAYHYLAGWPYRDVAVLVGSNPAAVRRAAVDGLRTLRATYPDLDPRGA